MQKKIDKIRIKRMKRMKRKVGSLFLKMHPSDFFWADPSLSLPQKVGVFMANCRRSHGANFFQMEATYHM
jgi:hypothetical protein